MSGSRKFSQRLSGGSSGTARKKMIALRLLLPARYVYKYVHEFMLL